MTRMPKEFDIFGLNDCFIAGGAILSTATKTKINDYDIYPKSKKGFEDAIEALMSENGCYLINASNRALTFKSNNYNNDNGERIIVQVMSFDIFPTAESIFEYFDFTVCMGAYDCDSKSYVFHEDFYPDIASKTLRFNHKTKYPLNSLIRVSKYQTKGYYISKLESAKVALAVAKTGLPNSWSELENQLGGTYGNTIKLATEDLEFTYENAIDILSNTVFEFIDYDNEKYSGVKCQDILNCYLDENVEYISVTSSFGNESNFYHILKDGFFISDRFSKEVYHSIGTKSNYKEKTDGNVFGYSTEKQIKQSFSSKEFFTDKSKIKNHSDENKIVLMSIKINNIKQVNGYYVYGEVKQEKTVSVDTSRVDDVNEVIFATLTT